MQDVHHVQVVSTLIVGLERSLTSDYKKDYIYHFEGAQCCKGTPHCYENQNELCARVDWVHNFGGWVLITIYYDK